MADYAMKTFLKTRSYPAYQFSAYLRYDAQSPRKCLDYVILTVMAWIRQKLGGEEVPKELDTPDSRDFTQVVPEEFVSYHFQEGISLDITSLPDNGIWALQIHEPDTDTTDHRAVIGRTLVTDVALRVEEDRVAFAIRIEVLDPVGTQEELEYVRCPSFMRDLFATSKLRITQVGLLRFDQPYAVSNSHGLKHMMDVLRSQDNLMPSILFTYTIEKRKLMELVDILDETLALKGSEGSFRNQLSTLTLVPELLEFGNPILPYDADYVARHCYGHARVFLIASCEFKAFQNHIGKDIHPGDVIWMEPVRYGGNSQVYVYSTQDSAVTRERVRDELLHKAYVFSKNRDVPYTGIVFESAARRQETEIRVHEMLSILKEDNQQATDELYHETEELLELYEQEKTQMEQEMERLRSENQEMSGKLLFLDSRLGEQEREEKDALIKVPAIKEFYRDEQHDLLVSILRHYKGLSSMCPSEALRSLTRIHEERPRLRATPQRIIQV